MTLMTSIKIQGENFLVEELEKELGIEISKKSVKGQICNYGRFKGKPFPYSSATIKATDINADVDLEFGTFDLMLDFALDNKNRILGLGADSLDIDVAIYHLGLAGWELSQEQISKLNKLDTNLLISFYEEE